MLLRNIIAISSIIILSSCSHFEEDKNVVKEQVKHDAKDVQGNIEKNAIRVANNVRDGIKRTGEKVREWWITPLPKKVEKPVPTRYCYRVLQDILCYRNQMPGWESKLVGYQGNNAMPPREAQMTMMSLREERLTLPIEERIAEAKPEVVIKDKKPDDKLIKKNMSTTNIPSETLPDPIISPQI
ncbi:MAG: hypothetical protein R3D71_05590 [Rickettsiales bacterium]